MTKITSPWALTNYEQTFKSYVKKSDIKSYFDKGDLVTEVHTNNFISFSVQSLSSSEKLSRSKLTFSAIKPVPALPGKQKILDKGRISKFNKKFQNHQKIFLKQIN